MKTPQSSNPFHATDDISLFVYQYYFLFHGNAWRYLQPPVHLLNEFLKGILRYSGVLLIPTNYAKKQSHYLLNYQYLPHCFHHIPSQSPHFFFIFHFYTFLSLSPYLVYKVEQVRKERSSLQFLSLFLHILILQVIRQPICFTTNGEMPILHHLCFPCTFTHLTLYTLVGKPSINQNLVFLQVVFSGVCSGIHVIP